LREAVRAMPEERNCKCGSALKHALVTDMKLVPKATRKKLDAIIAKYIS
jgi:5'-methylthioadenosine phosphorylase